MNPYEPEKVSKANELYSEVLHTDEQADKQLKQLRLRAIEELGIKFSTEKLFGKLSAACNPKNFTGESYNKERLELANRLYQAVMMNADNVLALEEIEGEAPSYKHAFSRWMYSGFRIKIFTGRLLSKDDKQEVMDKTTNVDFSSITHDWEKSKRLYDVLKKKYHPDLYTGEQNETATRLFQLLMEKKYNYPELLKIKEMVEKELGATFL